MVRPSHKNDSLFDVLVRFDANRRKRRDAFWDRIFDSSLGPMVQVILVAAFVLLGLFTCYNALQAASEGVIRGRTGVTYLAENPSWFWSRVAWRFGLGALFPVLCVAGLWSRFSPRGRRANKRAEQRRAKKERIGND